MFCDPCPGGSESPGEAPPQTEPSVGFPGASRRLPEASGHKTNHSNQLNLRNLKGLIKQWK